MWYLRVFLRLESWLKIMQARTVPPIISQTGPVKTYHCFHWDEHTATIIQLQLLDTAIYH